MIAYCSSGLRECSRLRVANKFTCRRPGASVRAFLPRTPKRKSSVTIGGMELSLSPYSARSLDANKTRTYTSFGEVVQIQSGFHSNCEDRTPATRTAVEFSL